MEIDNKNVMLVDMNDVGISSIDKPIIGTRALATCIGVLLYDRKGKKAIVGHLSDVKILPKMIDVIAENKLYYEPLEYLVIEGGYYNHYGLRSTIESFFKDSGKFFLPFDKMKLNDNSIMLDEKTNSNMFVFDSLTGEFVTDKINFDEIFVDRIKSK